MPDYLFDHNHKILERIDKSDFTFLFLDYDGTLVSFKDSPQDVVTPEKVKTILIQFALIPNYNNLRNQIKK